MPLAYSQTQKLHGLSEENRKDRWRPRTTIFLKAGFPIDNHVTTGFVFGTVILEQQKVSEFLHDGIRANNVNFRGLVIGADEQLAGMLSAMLAEAQAGKSRGSSLLAVDFGGAFGAPL